MCCTVGRVSAGRQPLLRTLSQLRVPLACLSSVDSRARRRSSCLWGRNHEAITRQSRRRSPCLGGRPRPPVQSPPPRSCCRHAGSPLTKQHLATGWTTGCRRPLRLRACRVRRAFRVRRVCRVRRSCRVRRQYLSRRATPLPAAPRWASPSRAKSRSPRRSCRPSPPPPRSPSVTDRPWYIPWSPNGGPTRS